MSRKVLERLAFILARHHGAEAEQAARIARRALRAVERRGLGEARARLLAIVQEAHRLLEEEERETSEGGV